MKKFGYNRASAIQSINRKIEKSKNARKGFTVIELLVASLLLGMLMMILTMIFNQSSIAWRTGVAGVADLDETRTTISDVRYQADNVYVWKNEAKYVRSVFDDNGNVRSDRQIGDMSKPRGSSFNFQAPSGMKAEDSYKSDVGCGSGQGASSKNYVINVMSCGPDRKQDTRYDNIYSLPDDPNNW